MKKSGFTLVEMLIVVVIIGILSVALLPKLTGYMARTRDMKRVADLRNIAAAIEMYRNDYGAFPKAFPKRNSIPKIIGSASDILGLETYITEIPKDPNKSQMIKIHSRPIFGKTEPGIIPLRGKNREGGSVLKPGEYLYQSLALSDSDRNSIGAIALVAKVETPAMANYMPNPGITWELSGPLGGYRFYSSLMSLSWIHFCENREKVTKAEQRVFPTATNKDCKWYSEEDLFYVQIVK